MADNRQNLGQPDRSRASTLEGYQVRYFAEKHSMTPDQARELIDRHGDDWETLDRAAKRLKGN